jgi:PilZ domain
MVFIYGIYEKMPGVGIRTDHGLRITDHGPRLYPFLHKSHSPSYQSRCFLTVLPSPQVQLVRTRFVPFHQRHRFMPQDGTRRSGRIPKQIAITLIGSDMEGRVFSERTKTVLLSRHGAGIISTYKLAAEQELVIRSEESRKEIEARVVGQIGSDGDTFIYGIAFLDRETNFWGFDFPDLSEAEKRASQTLLECGNCHARETADHSDLASDVMAINESIVRYCQKCGSSTLWKHAVPGSLPAGADPAGAPASTARDAYAEQVGPARVGQSGPGQSGEDAPDLPPRAEPPVAPGPWRDGKRPGITLEQPPAFAGATWTEPEAIARPGRDDPITPRASANRGALTEPAGESADTPSEVPRAESSSAAQSASRIALKGQENRRKHARTRVNLKACVRLPGSPNDVVACEDMSRGGLRFKSRRKYTEKMLIDVAVPYSPGDQAIFVPAQIAYVQELPEQKMYRCGVTYLRSGK